MKKVILSIATMFIFTFFAGASEPSSTIWSGNVKINAMYVGDYNVSNGRVYIVCSDSKMYYFNLGSELSKTMYTTALSAFTSGKIVNILRQNITTSEYQVYRMLITNQ